MCRAHAVSLPGVPISLLRRSTPRGVSPCTPSLGEGALEFGRRVIAALQRVAAWQVGFCVKPTVALVRQAARAHSGSRPLHLHHRGVGPAPVPAPRRLHARCAAAPTGAVLQHRSGCAYTAGSAVCIHFVRFGGSLILLMDVCGCVGCFCLARVCCLWSAAPVRVEVPACPGGAIGVITCLESFRFPSHSDG